MDTTQFIVNLVGVAAIGLIVWYFWLYRRAGFQVTDTGGVAHVTLSSGPANPSTLLGSHQLW